MKRKRMDSSSGKVDKDKIWQWSKVVLKIRTEALLCASQGVGHQGNLYKVPQWQDQWKPLCRLYGQKSQRVQHSVSGCEKLAQKEYKRQQDNVAKKVHWVLCKKYGLEQAGKWYEHVPEGTVKNE